jgi:hypothetical protein
VSGRRPSERRLSHDSAVLADADLRALAAADLVARGRRADAAALLAADNNQAVRQLRPPRLQDDPVQVVRQGSGLPEGYIYIEQGLVRRELKCDLAGAGPLEFAGPGEVLNREDGPLKVSPASRLLKIRKLRTPRAAPDAPPAVLPGGSSLLRSDFVPERIERYRIVRPGSPARVRLARLLVDLSLVQAPDSATEGTPVRILEVLATQADLARAVSASVASVENALRDFRKATVAMPGPGHRRYTILNLDRMREIAGGD